MTVRTAWLLPGGAEPGQTREDTRLAPLGTMTPGGALTTRTGVIPGGDPFGATDAGAMSLQIGIGRGAVQGTTAQGAYPVALDAPESVAFADGDAVFGRVDTVVIRVYDALFDVEGQNLAVVAVIEGEPLASPTRPLLPSACLPLWDVAVPAGTSAGVGGINWGSALTDRRRYAVAVGGISPLGVDESAAGVYDGQYRDNGAGLERWHAAEGEWRGIAAQLQPYTPVLTSTTLGNGKVQARYQVVGNRCAVNWILDWGSSTGGNMPSLSVPVPPRALGGMRWTGSVLVNRGAGSFKSGPTWLYDTATAIVSGLIFTDGASTSVSNNFAAMGISMAAGGWVSGQIEYEV